MKRAFGLYQYLGPAILTPLAIWLWLRHYDGDRGRTAIAVTIPILYAYIVPGIGTNVLRMWAINARFRLGRFRPQHGFVFGAATAVLALATIGGPDVELRWTGVLQSAATTCALLLAVNWIYDALAIRAGVLEVYNQAWSEGRGPWRIAADYVVWFFGLFGFVYAAGLRILETLLPANPAPTAAFAAGLSLLCAVLALPPLAYIGASLLRHGHTGCCPFARPAEETA
jgi:hypothetical protein